VELVRQADDRLLTADATRWILLNATDGAAIAPGEPDAIPDNVQLGRTFVDLEGSNFVV
jgi:hypothetical protein